MIATHTNRIGGLVGFLLVVSASLFGAPAGERSDAMSGNVSVFPFRIRDAEFSTSLNAIVVVREAPHQLVIYDPDAGTSFAVGLPAAPTCVGVSPNGRRAAVGHDRAVSEVDLVAGAVTQTLAVTFEVDDIIHGGNGFMHLFGRYEATSLDLSTGALSRVYDDGGLAVRLHPAGDRIYGTNVFQYQRPLERFDVGAGPLVWGWYSDRDYDLCKNVWIAEDGSRLFSGCGVAFRSAAERSADMAYAGRLSEESLVQWLNHSAAQNSVAVLPGYSPYYGSQVRADDEIRYYAYDSLLYRGRLALPEFVAEGKSSRSRGRWHFFNAAGTKQYVIVQADPEAGITNDYGLVTIDCTGATVSLTPAVVEAASGSGQVSIDVVGSAGCVWTAQTEAPWLQTVSTGAGSGTILVNLQANPNSWPREATVRVGTATATIRQAAASAEPVEPTPPVVTLPFRLIDAEYSKTLNAIVAISEYGLHVYDTGTRAVSTLSLDAVARCVSVSPDGLHAAVGHSGAISYVDLASMALVKKLDVTAEIADIVLGESGYVYVFPTVRGWEALYNIEISSNRQSVDERISFPGGSSGRLHPNGMWLYVDMNYLPSDMAKGDVSSGPVGLLREMPDDSYAMCDDLWIAADGKRVYSACGNVFRSTGDSVTDMTYLGTMENAPRLRWVSDSTAFGSIAAVPSSKVEEGELPPREDEIHYYALDTFAHQGRMVLPSFTSGSDTWQSRGRWHFFSPDGMKQHVLVQADPESGLQLDFGVVTVDCAGAAVSLAPTSAQIGWEGGTIEVAVTAKPGCGWRATTSASWLTARSAGVSDGVVPIAVSANSAFAKRIGRVSIGDKTFNVVQAPVGISSVQATATGSSSVALTWATTLSPHHYEVWRNVGSGFTLIGSPQTKSFTDASAPVRSALIYRVRAVMTDGTTTDFAADYAHTFPLSDSSLSGVAIRAVHVEELRAVANALRVVAGAGAVSHTDPQLAGVVAKLTHVTELRAAINGMRAALGLAAHTFSPLSAGATLAGATTQELRDALR